MTGLELTDHLAEDEIQIDSCRYVGHQGSVALLHLIPPDAVHLRVVEPVATDAPVLVEHLSPLGPRIEPHAQIGESELVALAVGLGLRNGPITSRPVEHLLATCRKSIVLDSCDDFLFLSLLQVEPHQCR